MGRSIRRRQEALQVRDGAYDRALARPAKRAGPDLDGIRRAVLAGNADRAIRDPAAWACALRTRDPGRIALDLARHAYARYPVPHHLERVWLGGERLSRSERALRKAWYVTVAQGGSLHKAHTGAFLSKRETHRFLTPPGALTFREALWYAIARSTCDDHGACLRIAKSKVARDGVTPFWKDAARFFCASGLPIAEVNDLVDYLAHRVGLDRDFSLKGRSVPALQAAMHAWHRDLARKARIGGGSWAGHPVPGYERVEPGDATGFEATWRVVQILTGDDLAEEGSAQRHCVATYKPGCMRGECSIWSLRRSDWSGTRRMLTMEVRRDRRIVQVRGFANRAASAEEMRHVRRWAGEAGLTIVAG